jgi:hypothetical protein
MSPRDIFRENLLTMISRFLSVPYNLTEEEIKAELKRTLDEWER